MRRYAVATAPALTSLHWEQLAPMTWDELVTWLDLENPADHKDCGGYVLGELRETTVRHPKARTDCTGLHRTRSSIVSRSVVTLDADTPSPSFLVDLALELGCRGLVHTTWSHAPRAPRSRVLLPLSREVTPEDYRLVVGALIHDLGAAQFDSGSVQPERLMHRPSTQGAFEFHLLEGDLLDADEWVMRAKELELPSKPAFDAPLRQAGPAYEDLSPREQAMAIREVQRVTNHWQRAFVEAERWPEDERDAQGRGWEALCRDAAWALAKLVASPWAPLDEDEARECFEAIVPEVIAMAESGERGARCGDKWHPGIVAKASEAGTGLPPWSSDFDPLPAAAETVPSAPAEADEVLSRFARTDFAALLDPNRPPREYVVDPLIQAGTSVALVAPAGQRKSLLLLRLALAVARGEPTFAGMPIPRARRVLYIDMELTEDDLADRLRSFGVTAAELAALDSFVHVLLPSMNPLDTARGGAELVEAVEAYGLGPGDLVVLDSYQRVTEAGENDSDTTRGYYRHTGVHLKALGLTVVRTDNTGKDVAKGARGSSGKRDDVDVEYLMQSNGDYIDIKVGKHRQGGVEELTIYVTTDEDGLTSFRENGQSPGRSRLAEAIDVLNELGLPLDVSQRVAEKAVKLAGHHVTRAILREALKARKEAAADFQPIRDPDF